MLFTKLIKKIVTGVLLTTFIVGHMGEICVYAAEGDGSLSGNAAEEALWLWVRLVSLGIK